jgi:pimeloyl-ACP methyl ester carboxylesterase
MAYTLADNIAIYYEAPRGLLTDRGQVLTLLIHGAGGSCQHWQPLKMRVAGDCLDFINLSNLDLHGNLSTLTMPTLIITGNDDVIISPRHSHLLHREIPSSTLVVIPDGGHYVHIEQPERVAGILNHFSSIPERNTFA